MKNWTDARLDRLFAHYNLLFWRGRLPRFAVHVRKLPDELNCVGFCDEKKREILIDAARLGSDRKIRDALLHEMAHAAAHSPSHGYKFTAQLERLRKQNAPISVGFPETDGVKFLSAEAVPRRFPLVRRAMELAGLRASRESRVIERYAKKKNLTFHQTTDKEIVFQFVDAGSELDFNWAMTRRFVGNENGLLDVGGKPRNAWARRILRTGKKAFNQAVKDHAAHVQAAKLLEAAARGQAQKTNCPPTASGASPKPDTA